MGTSLTVEYDKTGDILYLGKPKPYPEQDSEELGYGVVARLNPKTRDLENLEILFFSSRVAKGETFQPIVGDCGVSSAESRMTRIQAFPAQPSECSWDRFMAQDVRLSHDPEPSLLEARFSDDRDVQGLLPTMRLHTGANRRRTKDFSRVHHSQAKDSDHFGAGYERERTENVS